LLPPAPARWPRRLLAAGLTGLVVLAFWSAAVPWERLADLPGEFLRYLWLMFSQPNWEKLPDAMLQTWRSIAMAWVGTVLGVIVATPLSFLAAGGLGPLWLRAPLRGLFAVIRAVPEIIIAIIILSVTGLTPLTGALALAVGGVGTLGKWGYEAIESAPTGAAQAARAAGGGTAQIVRWGVWPQVSADFLSFWLYRFEINVRASAVLGLIGVGGIGDMLASYTQYRDWPTVGVLLIVVVIATMTIDALSSRVRRRLTEGARRRA
jgi:phosphonate transport system permease protein